MVTPVMILLAAGGCTVGGNNDLRGNNQRLRVERNALANQVDELTDRIEGLVVQLQAVESGVSGAESFPGITRPVVTEIRIDRYTALLDTDDDGAPDQLKVFLTLHDQDGRHVPAPGRVRVALDGASEADLQAGADGQQLMSAVFGPAQFHDAYRSGFMGTHYTLEVPGVTIPAGVASLNIRVSFTDAITGAELVAERTMAY